MNVVATTRYIDTRIRQERRHELESRLRCSYREYAAGRGEPGYRLGSTGVGTVLIRDREMGTLGISEEYEPYYGLALGYKDPTHQPAAPKRTPGTVNYIR